MQRKSFKIKSRPSIEETAARKEILQLFRDCPIPENELLSNLGLFLRRQELSKMLFMDYVYQKILGVHGVVMEFGVRWGRNLALFESLRGMYEPFNHNRKIVGFDTFSGFPTTHKKDGRADIVARGAYGVPSGYEGYLDQILRYHERESPLSHMQKYELVKGDAAATIKKYVARRPETIVALAYFDLDLYKPTKSCLQVLKKYVTKGSVLAFDQLNFSDFPGETEAFKEVFGLDTYKISRSPHGTAQSFIRIQ